MTICPQGENTDVMLARTPVCTTDHVLTVNSVTRYRGPPWKGRGTPKVPADAKTQAPQSSHVEVLPSTLSPF